MMLLECNMLREPAGSRQTREPVRVARKYPRVTGDPWRSYTEAMSRADAAEWDAACEDERCAFERLGVYEVVPRPKGRKVIGSKWVFRIKRGPDGAVQKYKA